MDPSTLTLIVAAISAGAALFGAGIGAVVSYFVSRLQFRASVRSVNRQAWINDLRDTLAEFLATATSINLFHSGIGTKTDFIRWLERAVFLRSKLVLLVNPQEEDHYHLIKQVDRLLAGSADPQKRAHQETGELIKEITKTAQPLLKREWERVKRGE